MENRTKNGGPKAPKPDRLSELIDFLTEHKAGDDADLNSVSIGPDHDDMIQECIDALDWTATMLGNRKGYQQKQQQKRKVLEDWAKKNLSPDELAEIDRQAALRVNEKEVQRG